MCWEQTWAKVFTKNIQDTWKTKGKKSTKKSTWLIMTCMWFDHFEAFLKFWLDNQSASWVIWISETIFRVSAQVWWTLVPAERPSYWFTLSSFSLSYFQWFFCFVILSSLRSFAFRLLWALAFVSLLLRPSVLPCWLIERGDVGRGGDGFDQHSGLEGSRRGRLHDLLTNFPDLQLQTQLGGESVRVACLEGSCGLSWRGEKKEDEGDKWVEN